MLLRLCFLMFALRVQEFDRLEFKSLSLGTLIPNCRKESMVCGVWLRVYASRRECINN